MLHCAEHSQPNDSDDRKRANRKRLHQEKRLPRGKKSTRPRVLKYRWRLSGFEKRSPRYSNQSAHNSDSTVLLITGEHGTSKSERLRLTRSHPPEWGRSVLTDYCFGQTSRTDFTNPPRSDRLRVVLGTRRVRVSTGSTQAAPGSVWTGQWR